MAMRSDDEAAAMQEGSFATILRMKTDFKVTVEAVGPAPGIPMAVDIQLLAPQLITIPMGSSQSISIPVEETFEPGHSKDLPFSSLTASININGTQMPVPVLTFFGPASQVVDPLDHSTPHVRVILTNAIITVDTPPDI